MKTIRDQRRALLGWSIGLVLVVAMYAAFYPSVRDNAGQLNRYFDNLPAAVQRAFGGTEAFTTSVGYLWGEVYSLIAPLLLTIFAIGAGARAIAGEEEEKTLDVLLSTPTPRSRVAWQKFAALVATTTFLGVVLCGAVALLGPRFRLEVSLSRLAAATGACVLLALVFGAIALLVGCWRGRRGSAVGAAAAMALAAYLIDILAPSVRSLHGLQKLSPFYYYSANEPLRNGLDPGHAGILAAMAVVALILAMVGFERRDLTT